MRPAASQTPATESLPLTDILTQLSILAPRRFRQVSTPSGRIRAEFKVFLPPSPYQQIVWGVVPRARRWHSVYTARVIKTGQTFGGAVHEARLQAALQALCDERRWQWQLGTAPWSASEVPAASGGYQVQLGMGEEDWGGWRCTARGNTAVQAMSLAVLMALQAGR